MIDSGSSGIVLLDKDSGESSARSIARVKRKLGLAKIGHAGTLDPLATGLLIVLVNRATRLARYAEAGRKVYSGTFELGVSTDTHDCMGQVVSRSEAIPDFENVALLVKGLCGAIEQIPPQVSALKVNGKRAYDLVRKGEQVSLPARTVSIFSFAVRPLSNVAIEFRVECSKGTYVRSLVRDIGMQLGCGASLTALRREASLPFVVKDAKTVESLDSSDILDWRLLFPSTPSVTVNGDDAVRLLRGDEHVLERIQSRETMPSADSPMLCIHGDSGKPLGVLEWRRQMLSYGVNVCQHL